MPTVLDLIRALPEPAEEPAPSELDPMGALQASWAMRPVPVGRFSRLRVLGTLQAKIAAAYLFYWLRGWFKDADENKRLLAETHWRTAVRVLDSMSYLRGAVMKVGQTLANFPDIVPQQFVEALDDLHFSAPSMHWSLIGELVYSELGDDPDNLFASFQKKAFAAASLGQVHGATLNSGQDVAVKIQYPGIARTIREDVRNLVLLMAPARLGRDWDNTKDQLDDLRMRLERETDYELEAAMLGRAQRALFREDDGIAVPRVIPELSTARVLTMERLPGVHLDQFLATNPSQELRNAFACKLVVAWYRLFYAARLINCDVHPGNFLFMDDGRLGVLDFGFMIEIDDTMWGLMERIDRAITTGRLEDRVAALKEWSWIGDNAADQEFIRLSEQFADWQWRARSDACAFDFGDEADFRRGVDLFVEMVRKRYSRARACTPAIARQYFGLRSLLYKLRANIDITPIAEKEVRHRLGPARVRPKLMTLGAWLSETAETITPEPNS